MAKLPKIFSSVQALRGLAALAVVLYHGDLLAHEYQVGPLADFKGGEAGVDLFFTISGCVMVASTAKLWGDRTSWRIFFLRRLIRVVPLYWIFTSFKLASMIALPGVVRHMAINWHLIVASLFFISTFNPDYNAMLPVLTVGWTLNYEMFFYALFALSLGLARNPIPFLISLLLFLVGLSFFRTPAWGYYTAPVNVLLLEFVFGIMIALAARADRLLPVMPALLLAAGMLLLIICNFHPFGPDSPGINTNHYRAFFPGIPCGLLVYAALSLELPLRRWVAGFPLLIGDASYSIYLSHPFVLAPLGSFWHRLHWEGVASAHVLVALCLAVSLVVGIVVHQYLESPLLHFLNKKVHQPDPVGIRASA